MALTSSVGLWKVGIAQDAATDDGEPQLYLVQPGAVSRRVVEDESVTVVTVPIVDEVSPRGIGMGVQIVEHNMDPGLAIGRRHRVDKREKIRSGARFGTSRQHFPGSGVEAGKQAAGAVALVLEVHAPRPPRLRDLQLTASRKRLHARLLVDAQYRLATRAFDVELDNRTHFLLKLRILAVTPAPHPVWLDLGLVENSSDLAGADLAYQLRFYQRFAQRHVGPHRWQKPKVRRRTARRCNDLVTFQRGDLSRSTAPLAIVQPFQALLLKTAQPLADSKAVCSQLAGNRRDRFSIRCKQYHPGASITARFGCLSANDLFEVYSYSSRKTKIHITDCTRTLGVLD